MQTNDTHHAKGKVRGFFMFYLLHFITLGAYHPIWWYKVSDEVNQFLGHKRMNATKILFLSPLTLGIYTLIWQFSEGKKIIREVQERAGLPPKTPFFVGPWQLQSSLNNVWRSLPA